VTKQGCLFDALGSKRCYKEAWTADDIRGFITEQTGKKFDPRLVQLLFDNWTRAEQIRTRFPD